jgi:hypothetical protein
MSVTAVVRHRVADYDAGRTVHVTLAERGGGSCALLAVPLGKPVPWTSAADYCDCAA